MSRAYAQKKARGPKLISGTVYCKVRENRTPYGNALVGYRFVSTLPNKEGHTYSGEPCTSYRKPYLVFVSSDMTEYPSETFVQQWTKMMKDFGFCEVHWEGL
jgi:hypothetical protein